MLLHKMLSTAAPALMLLLTTADVSAQATRHLLWFTGHWSKDKKNLFIIEAPRDSTTGGTPAAGSQGGTITADPDGSLHLHTGGVDAWNKWVDKALRSEDTFIQDLNNPQDNLDPATHQLYQLLLPDAEERQQQLNDYRIDPGQDMLTGQKPAAAKPAPTVIDLIAGYCSQTKSDYDEVMNFYASHVKGHPDDPNIPSPPAFEYSCYACDSNLRKIYDTSVEHYTRDFLHPEDSILTKGFRILHNLALAGIARQTATDPDAGDALFRTGTCAYIDQEKLYQAVYETAHHLYLRGEKLVRTNRNNFKAATSIIRTYVTVARQWALLSGDESGFETLTPVLIGLVKQSIDYYHDAFVKKDWRTIGNIPFLLDQYRNEAMLGGDGQDSREYLTRLLKVINGFKLSIEMDIKIGKDGGYRLAHLKGECHIIPVFQQDSNQCYKWVVADEDQQDVVGFYKPRQPQTIDCQLIANEMITPPNAPRIAYTGTKKYCAGLQSLSMDFCNPGHDTIMLTGFTPNPATAGTWQLPYGPPQNLAANGMEQYFEDVKAKKKLAGDGQAQKEAGDMKEQGQQLKKEMEALKQQISGSQGAINFEKMQELVNKAHALTTTAVAGRLLYLDFLLPVQNNNSVLVDKKFDAREINPSESNVIVYGYYTIHIENNANGKTKPTSK